MRDGLGRVGEGHGFEPLGDVRGGDGRDFRYGVAGADDAECTGSVAWVEAVGGEELELRESAVDFVQSRDPLRLKGILK